MLTPLNINPFFTKTPNDKPSTHNKNLRNKQKRSPKPIKQKPPNTTPYNNYICTNQKTRNKFNSTPSNNNKPQTLIHTQTPKNIKTKNHNKYKISLTPNDQKTKNNNNNNNNNKLKQNRKCKTTYNSLPQQCPNKNPNQITKITSKQQTKTYKKQPYFSLAIHSTHNYYYYLAVTLKPIQALCPISYKHTHPHIGTDAKIISLNAQ